MAVRLRSGSKMTLGEEDFFARDSFPSGLLPTARMVIEMLAWHLLPKGKGYTCPTREEAAMLTSETLIEHWIWYNVYPRKKQNVVKKIDKLYSEFKQKRRTKVKQTEKWKEETVRPFLESLEKGFDIRTEDDKARKKLEEQYEVRETEKEHEFWEDQMLGERKMFCESFVDRKWQTLHDRKTKEKAAQQKMMMQQQVEIENMKKVPLPKDLEEELMSVCDEEKDGNDNDFVEMEDEAEVEEETEKKRRKLVHKSTESGSLPEGYNHVRRSIGRVRPEYYRCTDRMVSELHMSQDQAIGSVVIVAKEMFGLNWKRFEEDQQMIDLDTVPDKKRNREVGKALEAFALSTIVEEIMKSNDNSTVVYHDDGSKTQGAGSYSVQGVTINKKYFAFPTLSLARETRTNLALLKVTVLNILSVCGNVPADQLWEKIDFVMTDGTSHNLEVDEKVADHLGSEHVPGHLLCQVHPALMFSRKLQAFWGDVDTAIGPEKIFAGFAVSLSDQQVSVTQQWMDCVTRLVTHDFDQKPWNRAGDFDLFISPLSNPAKRLIKERFNSLPYTCLVTNWLDRHVTAFLAKYSNVTNSLACIIRSFEDIKYLRILSTVGVILGVHLIEPYLSLTSSSQTTWEKLVVAFPQLYNDLTSVKPELLLDLSSPAFSFVSSERFEACAYPANLIEPTLEFIEENRSEVVAALKILLPKLASGWALQRGDMFEFGDNQDSSFSMKISDYDQEKLKLAPISNLDAERSVGAINYELKIRGNKELKAASASHVKGKAARLMEGREMDKRFVKLTKKEGELPAIIKEWEEKQEELKKEGLDAKEVGNIASDKQRNADLAKLTEQGGPFTSPEGVKEYIANNEESDETKNKRMYIEVRHAKNASLSFPKSSEVFRLKKGGRNLSTEEYGSNLVAYLRRITCYVNLSEADFKDALVKLSV